MQLPMMYIRDNARLFKCMSIFYMHFCNILSIIIGIKKDWKIQLFIHIEARYYIYISFEMLDQKALEDFNDIYP